MDFAISKNDVKIRLTDERWKHITDGHQELAEFREQVLKTVSEPDRVLEGNNSALMGVKKITPTKYVVVIYRENQDDGFIVTAFLTGNLNYMDRRKQLWP